MESFYAEHLKQNQRNEKGMSKHHRYLWFCTHCNHAGFSHHSRGKNHLWIKHQISYHVERVEKDKNTLKQMRKQITELEKLHLEGMLAETKEDYLVQKEITEKIKSICLSLLSK
jgi:hypothetical protein